MGANQRSRLEIQVGYRVVVMGFKSHALSASSHAVLH